MIPVELICNCVIREKYGPIFRVYLGGRYMVVVSCPVGVDNVLWRPRNLDVFEFQMTHRLAGIRDRRAAYIYETVTKPAMEVATRELAKRHVAVPALTFGLDFLDRLRPRPDSHCQVKWLSKFIQTNMYESISIALWGPMLPTDGDMIQDFLTMDVGMAGILTGMPWSRIAARRSRTRLAHHFKEYVRVAWRDEDQTLDGASTLINHTVALSKGAIDEDELARFLLVIHWGSLSNVMNAAIWLWYYLLADGSAFLRVRDEINAAIADRFGDVESLVRAGPSAFDDPCFATLNSAIRETLRLIVLPASVRQAVKDTSLVIGGGQTYNLLKGDLVTVDVWNMHRDDEAWGEPHAFKVDRFVENESLKSQRGRMSRRKEFVPFGGGEHMVGHLRSRI
jgi:cytochrome P450